MSELAGNDYAGFFVEIKTRIRQAQYQALRAVNKDLLSLYWDSKTVVEYALRAAGRPIGVATYTVVPQLPEAYRDQLPSPEAIAERLRLWAGQKGAEE